MVVSERRYYERRGVKGAVEVLRWVRTSSTSHTPLLITYTAMFQRPTSTQASTYPTYHLPALSFASLHTSQHTHTNQLHLQLQLQLQPQRRLQFQHQRDYQKTTSDIAHQPKTADKNTTRSSTFRYKRPSLSRPHVSFTLSLTYRQRVGQ